MRTTYLFFTLLVLVPACFTLDDDRSDYYVEATVPDLYFTGPLRQDLVSILVEFATAPPQDPILEPAPDFTINVVTWSRFGDNYYDDSLGPAELRDPVKGQNRWIWSGMAALPRPDFPGGPTGARQIGIQIRGIPYEAVPSSPRHQWCWIEAMGLGVRECGEWIDAVLQLQLVCRGLVGEIIDCHGLGGVLVPNILVGGYGFRDPWPGGPMADDQQRKPFKYFWIPGLIFELDEDGWRYAEDDTRTLRRDEPDPGPPSFRGPFRDADAAARDFVETVGDQYAGLSRFGGSHGTMFAEDMYELLDAIDAHMDARYGR